MKINSAITTITVLLLALCPDSEEQAPQASGPISTSASASTGMDTGISTSAGPGASSAANLGATTPSATPGANTGATPGSNARPAGLASKPIRRSVKGQSDHKHDSLTTQTASSPPSN